MKLSPFAVFLLCTAGALHSSAQDAATSTVDLPPEKNQTPAPMTTPADLPDVPELSKLDEAFRETSLGKAADEYRIRIECRKLQSRVTNEPEIVAARKEVEVARTDLEKRDRLRDYYNIYYGRMRRLAASEETRKALDNIKAEHLRLLDQPRVRPAPGLTASPAPKKEKKSKKSHF